MWCVYCLRVVQIRSTRVRNSSVTAGPYVNGTRIRVSQFVCVRVCVYAYEPHRYGDILRRALCDTRYGTAGQGEMRGINIVNN